MATSHAALASAAAAGAASQAQERPLLSSGTRPPRLQPMGGPGEAPALPAPASLPVGALSGNKVTAYSALQPLMYGGPFYSMPFTYPPASSTAQMPTEQAPGVATGVVEAKPSDADGEPKHEGDDSEPVCCASFQPKCLCMGRPVALLAVDPAGDVHLGCCLSNPLWHLTWPNTERKIYVQVSNEDGTGGHEGLKPEAGGVQQSQTQPEGLQYLLPPDAAGNHAAALAALLRANQSTGGDRPSLVGGQGGSCLPTPLGSSKQHWPRSCELISQLVGTLSSGGNKQPNWQDQE